MREYGQPAMWKSVRHCYPPAVLKVPSHTRAPRSGSLISAAQLPHLRCRTPRYTDEHFLFVCLIVVAQVAIES